MTLVKNVAGVIGKVFIFLGVFAALFFAQKAFAATLALSPTSSSTGSGQQFTVQIILNTTGQNVDGVDIFSLHYNPSFLQVVDSNTGLAGIQIAPGSSLPVTLINAADNSAGTIQFSQTASGGTTFNGTGTIATITFLANNLGTSPVTFDFTPGSTSDTNVAAGGSDLLTAVTNGSYTVTAAADTTPPSSSITAPSNGATVSGTTVSVTASASDNVGIAGVQFLLDGANLGAEDTSTPYSVTWNTTTTTNGSHTLTARARDTSNNLTTSTGVSVTVNNADSTAPSVPGGVVATAQSSTQIQVSWNASTDNVAVTGYRVYRCQGASCTATVEVANITSGLTHQSSGLTASTVYGFRVRAYDAATNLSGFSTSVYATTQATPNQAPVGNFDEIRLSDGVARGWSYDPDASSTSNQVSLYIDGPSGSGTLLSTFATNTLRSDVNTAFGITGNHGFEYTIPAQYRNGVQHTIYTYGLDTSTSSTTHLTGSPLNFTLNVADTTAPTVLVTAPSNGANVSGTSTTVSATANDNVGVVGVQFLLDGNNLGAEDTSSPFSITWNTTTASNGSHNITARARDAAGNQTTSSQISVTVNNVSADTTPPSAPTNLSANVQSATQINLSWTASTDNVGVTGYRVEQCSGASCNNFTEIGTPTSTSFNNTGLIGLTTYRYRVRASDAAANLSSYSSIINATTQAPPDTTAPTVSITSPTNGTTISGTTSINATANDNIGVVGVQFRRGTVNLGAEDTNAPYAFSWDTTVVSNGSYALTAIARDAANNLTTSSIVNVTVNNVTAPPTDTTPPSVPTNLNASAASSSVINLSWSPSTDNVGVVGYRVYRSGTQIASAITATVYQDTGLAAQTSYSYTVLSYDAANNQSSQSSSAQATTQATGGVPPPPPPGPPPPPPPGGTPTPRPDQYPSGTIFKYPNDPTVYLKEGTVVRPITDWTVYLNQVPPTRHILEIPPTVVFERGANLGLRNGTLVRFINDPTVFLIAAGQKRPFSSEAEFRDNQYRFDQVYTINDPNLINQIQTTTDPFLRPIGTLFKYANNPTVYFLNSARLKRPFTTYTMFTLWIDNPKNIITVPDSETYQTGAIVTLPNGILVKGSAQTIYLSDTDRLRPFVNPTLFNAMGFRFDQVITIPDADINLHPIGTNME